MERTDGDQPAEATPLRVAIVGCGWAGARHASGFRAAGAELRWAVDTNLSRASAVLGPADLGRATADYRRALDDPSVDAVDICLPHALHAAVAVAAAESGKHVLCEKPIAATLDEADRMIVAAERAGVTLMVAENVRFDPLYAAVRELLDRGLIGEPALAQVTREADLADSFRRDRPWFLDRRAAAGGIMMSGGVHDFELLRMLIGEVTSVQALRARQRLAEMGGDDTSVALARFANGAAGVLVESFVMKSLPTAASPEVHTLRVDGDLGSLTVDADRLLTVFGERAHVLGTPHLGQHQLRVPAVDTFAAEIAHFVDCVRTGAEPLTSGRSQRRPLELVLAAYRAMETGTVVDVSGG
ncbi:MAG: Gfo/Idh/MocA family oxidoreductase [Chloroflexota bacterium]|nr:Gfo/Idh/MocA family oxidoreductase [Chloroflexota bacterium]